MNTKLEGANKSLEEQIIILTKILSQNQKLMKLLKILESDGLENYYVTAGCINQTIFNYYHDYDINYGINDFDIVYYDKDITYEKEDIIIKRLTKKINKLNIKTDIKNQARVHLWYYEKYGIKRIPYTSVEDAISKFGTTITCIGVRLEQNKLIVYAPYGLNDIFKMILRPVKIEFTKEHYDEKTNNWMNKWPKLTKIDW